jgi:hypothetical protein
MRIKKRFLVIENGKSRSGVKDPACERVRESKEKMILV